MKKRERGNDGSSHESLDTFNFSKRNSYKRVFLSETSNVERHKLNEKKPNCRGF